MRNWLALAAPLLLCATIEAEEIKSGLKVGEFVTTYSCTKLAGIDDGVAVNQSLCYT